MRDQLDEISNKVTESKKLLSKTSLTQSDVPDLWRETLTSSLFKGGKKTAPKEKTTDHLV